MTRTKRDAYRRARWIEGAARATDSALPSVRVFIAGSLCWRLVPRSPQNGHYDFAVDVRELICESIRFDVYAMWSDPRERFAQGHAR